MEAGRKKLFNTALLGTVIALAWPTMLEELMQTAVQYIDTAMVGAIDTHATAAVGSTTTIGWLIGSSIAAFGVGFLAYISQKRGSGEHGDARKASAQSVLAVLVIGAVFTALTLSLSGLVPKWMQVDESIRGLASEYFFILYTPMLARTAIIIFGTVLRAAGDTKTPMWIGLIVNVINVALNFLLIYETRVISVFGLEFTMWGAGLGVIGAGLASAISVTVGGAAITIALFKHREISPKGYSIKPDKRILRLQFEEMVYDYDSATRKIRDFLHLPDDPAPKSIFDPALSVANTQVFKRFPKFSEDIALIERELPEYLFDFSRFPEPDLSGKMFFGKSPKNK